MGLTLLDKALWLTGFAGHVALLGILVSRHRTASFPIFTAYISFQILTAIVDFAAYSSGNRTAYFWIYWSLVCIDALLQLGLVYEMARTVLRPTGHWAYSARSTFLSIGLCGALLAAGLACAIHPLASGTLAVWSIRLNLFTTLLIAELVIAMLLAATRVGLQWRNHVMAIAEGMAIWVCISIIVDTAHSYWGWKAGYNSLEYLRMAAYLVALAYWSLSLWRVEPARTAISPELQKYVYSIGHSLEYDLQTARELRKKS